MIGGLRQRKNNNIVVFFFLIYNNRIDLDACFEGTRVFSMDTCS